MMSWTVNCFLQSLPISQRSNKDAIETLPAVVMSFDGILAPALRTLLVYGVRHGYLSPGSTARVPMRTNMRHEHRNT